jgi:hypothetical protein
MYGKIRRMVTLTQEMLETARAISAVRAVGHSAPSIEGVLSEALRIGMMILAKSVGVG